MTWIRRRKEKDEEKVEKKGQRKSEEEEKEKEVGARNMENELRVDKRHNKGEKRRESGRKN